MEVKVLRNFIYDGAFRATDEVFDMPADDVPEYENRGNVIRLLQNPSKVQPAVDELPPLNDIVRKRK